jgi:hypothetical protein
VNTTSENIQVDSKLARPASELEQLHEQLQQANDLISVLYNRLGPVCHADPLIDPATDYAPPHISAALQASTIINSQLRAIIESLAI